MSKVLSVDYGGKRIGFASGDLVNKIASPLEVIENKGFNFVVSRLKQLCEEWNVDLVIFGLPLNMDDNHEENEIMVKLKAFVEKFSLEMEGRVKVEFVDERLSSFEAEALINELEEKGGKKIGKDAYEAAIILQRYFDKEQ